MSEQRFLAGVIEGFYGRPWSKSQRREMLDWLSESGLDTYCYAPKDDLKHRARWREPYDAAEVADLGELVDACNARGLRFIYALGPGLDIVYSSADDLTTIKARFDQFIDMGVDSFALLFDDIPVAMHPQDRDAFSSFAGGHAHVANSVFEWLESRIEAPRLLFCPTPYCGRMDREGLGGVGYLDEIGVSLHPSVDVFWTGPDIISRSIEDEHIASLSSRLRRSPVIWDNLHANDYDQQRVFVGPYCRRVSRPRSLLTGVLLNPNCEFEANLIPIRTLARYLEAGGGRSDPYEPRTSYLEMIDRWLDRFDSVGEPWSREDVRMLGDIHYLPHENSDFADELVAIARTVIGASPSEWLGADQRIREIAAGVDSVFRKLTELRNRELFYTFNRRWWALREEMQVMVRFVEWRKGGSPDRFRSPGHMPGPYRGGVVAELQRLLDVNDDGTVTPRRSTR